MLIPTGSGEDRAREAAAGSPEDGVAARWITAGNGHYALVDGLWRRTMWRHRRHPLRRWNDPSDAAGLWRYDSVEGPEVPGAVSVLDAHGLVVDMIAPELALSALADVKTCQDHLGLSGGTLSTYISRGHFPRPVVMIGDCRAWPWTVIESYLELRPADPTFTPPRIA